LLFFVDADAGVLVLMLL